MSDDRFLFEVPREFLIRRIYELQQELECIAVASEQVFDFPVDVGRYIVVDGNGELRMQVDEDKYALKDIETIASALSIKGNYCSVLFVMCGVEDLISEWSNGGRVVRCK